MAKVLWRGKNKEDGELQLEQFIKPADPNARLEKDKDGTWIIIGNAVMGSKPVVVKK